VLQRDGDHPWAKLGLAQAQLASSQPKAAVTLLTRAPAAGPTANLASLFLGRAYEALKDNANAAAAYRHAVVADSTFLEARQALGRLYLREKRFDDAFRQFSRVLAYDPRNAEMASLLAKVQPLVSEQGARLEPVRKPIGAVAASPVFPKGVPALRIGIATTPLGRPRARLAAAFSATTDFALKDAKTGKAFARGKADEFWVVRLKRAKKGALLELTDASGKLRQTRAGPFLIAPEDRKKGLVAINLAAEPGAAAAGADRVLRGEVEFAAWKGTLRIVNRLDLENYTHGVIAAEMPIRSPLEALKAQAVVARTHAIYIQKVTRRHHKDGYDLCDEQHCQVYAGARAESERSRAVVEATHGIIVTYKDRPAHVIYSSNCGGHTQDGEGLTGWGRVPYWLGVPDSADASAAPDSPWALRQWLGASPAAFCKPSNFVHPAHFRWARQVPWTLLSRRIDQRYRTGRLKSIRVLRRAASGNVNAILLEGAARKVKVDSEMAIRGLPGLGSLRSTLFVFTPEFGADGKPSAMVFRGGGWGHGVGLCQSGAMGRAEAGQNFPQIVLSYYPGTALGRADYAPEGAY
jgi:SpoIID/LytB domain protein